MTVVAWDGDLLAADKMTSFGGLHATTTKVHRLKSGAITAGCGTAALIAEMRRWIDDGADPVAFPAGQRNAQECASMLVAEPGGRLLQYESTPYPIVIENRHWAIGSGRDFAMMAMHLGHSALDAVLLTSLLCADCGNGVDAMRHDKQSAGGAS